MPSITEIQVNPVKVPRKHFKNARGPADHITAAIVQIHTDVGMVGLGEVDPFESLPDETLEELVFVMRRFLSPALLGEDPRNVEKLRLKMDTALSAHSIAKDCLEMALVDVAARLQGVPAAYLLGGQLVDRVPVIAPLTMGSPEATAQAAADYVARGFTCVKLKIGLEPEMDVERVRAVREAVGPAVLLRADANGCYSFGDALKTLRKMERYGMQCVEQPLPGWDLDGMARLCALVETPLMADESLHDGASAMEILRRRAAGMLHVKIQGHGGMLRARRVIAMAEAAGVPCIIGRISQMSIGATAEAVLAASSTNVLFPAEVAGPLIVNGDVVTKPVDLSRGALELSSGPGFGLEIDPEALARYTIPMSPLD